jgi:hypothetical protein
MGSLQLDCCRKEVIYLARNWSATVGTELGPVKHSIMLLCHHDKDIYIHVVFSDIPDCFGA